MLRILISALLGLLLLGTPAWGQPAAQAPRNQPPVRHIPEDSNLPASMDKKQLQRINQERFHKLKHDTDELYRLASELKDSVDKTDQNQLSVDVMKKAEQIEKLAKSVHDKMRGY